ncbi:MAG: hypothetical protein WD044_15110 [Dongiaceae bacterium]
MLNWFKRGRTSRKPAASVSTIPEAAISYFDAAVQATDKQFAEIWLFDPDWVGLLSVASELDQINGNTKKISEIVDTVLNAFTAGQTVDVCASALLLKHIANQRDSENLRRSSQISEFRHTHAQSSSVSTEIFTRQSEASIHPDNREPVATDSPQIDKPNPHDLRTNSWRDTGGTAVPDSALGRLQSEYNHYRMRGGPLGSVEWMKSVKNIVPFNVTHRNPHDFRSMKWRDADGVPVPDHVVSRSQGEYNHYRMQGGSLSGIEWMRSIRNFRPRE